MITKSDWRTVNQQLMSDDRRRVGEPPTAEEMFAYTRGELSVEEEARVRERLVCHPDLVRTLTEPFPSEGAQPGDPDYVSDEEFAAQWPQLQQRMRGTKTERGGRVLQFWRGFAAVAAAAAVVLCTMLVQSRSQSAEPRLVWQEQVLLPEGRRGPNEPVPISVQGDSILLITSLIGQREFDQYRLEIVRVATNRSIWQSTAVRPGGDNAFAILVPRRFLQSGEYRIVAYGMTGTGQERLSTYAFRIQ